MNLLPKSREEFSQKEYWDAFFKKRGPKAFEWYGEYPELSGQLHKYVKNTDKILIAGCGNSTLGKDLYDIGHINITNIDISQVVIRQMLSQTEKERPNLKYLQMDVLNMSFGDEEFSVVLDKGTLDALMPDGSPGTITKITKYFSEIERVLKVWGRYICVSLLQDHILKILLEYFPARWMFRVLRCVESESKAVTDGASSMPVFMVICTKAKQLPRKILELDILSSNKFDRYETVEDVINEIATLQRTAFICAGLKQTSIGEDDEVFFELFKVGEGQPRFTVWIVDIKPVPGYSQYGAFIVPQGRESEWLFSTKEGRQHLTKTANYNRLSLFTLHRGQTYGDFETVKAEISYAVCQFAPKNLREKTIPFLSFGESVGNRTIRCEGRSQLSGEYLVEDVDADNEKVRRLYFLNNQLVIQSEAKLKTIKTKRGVREIADLTQLTCFHHNYLSAAISSVAKLKGSCSVAVIGLGGGGLCSFLRNFLPKIRITAVEIDEDMLKVATNWFGLNPDNNLQVLIKDGLDYLQELASAADNLDVIIFDVDSKDNTIGMSCPPRQFLGMSVLHNVSRILSKDGLFLLNLVMRDGSLRSSVLDGIKKKFKTILGYKLEDDVNEILFCKTERVNANNLKSALVEGARSFNQYCRRNASKNGDIINVDELLGSMEIISE